jgi:hypothetical protein
MIPDPTMAARRNADPTPSAATRRESVIYQRCG